MRPQPRIGERQREQFKIFKFGENRKFKNPKGKFLTILSFSFVNLVNMRNFTSTLHRALGNESREMEHFYE